MAGKKTPTKAAKKTATRGGKVKKVKDPNAPKRPLSAYMFFGQAMRSKIVAANPQMKATEIMQQLGVEWKKCGDKDKAKYEAQAAADKTRYDNAMKKYKAK